MHVCVFVCVCACVHVCVQALAIMGCCPDPMSDGNLEWLGRAVSNELGNYG